MAKKKQTGKKTSSKTENSNGKEIKEAGVVPISDMYEDYFLDYASYVILERAVPTIGDGFKPVQRRIMHSMKEMDDGRFNKVANVIGHTMQFHPHGDAAIGAAMVNMGQKDLLIDTQGNWGDIRTGDSAAAPRYIEARLSKFALEVVFNADTTEWQLSYDGRKKEPVELPVKFPLLLAQGAEGIAVGLSTKILPHNFCELIKGSIDVLNGKKTKLLPDFPTGGMIDVEEYKRGKRGGRVKIRAKMEQVDKKTLKITEIPYTTTTSGLIDSIIKANDKGKIKIKQVVDNTAAEIEILIQLAPGISPDVTMDALYAFTDCEMSVSPNACVIVDDKPQFMTVDDILEVSTNATRELLKQELQIKQNDLEEKWHFSSLEKIFIENRIYRDIEECETWEAVIEAIDKGLKPHVKHLKRKVTEEDIVKLTEIKIKRISKYDSFKADELLIKLEDDIKQVKKDLKNLTAFAIAYFEKLLEKYGEGRERKTEIRSFETIKVRQVAVANKKLYLDAKEGFVGYGLRGAEQIGECSDLDNIIVFLKNGMVMVVPAEEKRFVGKDIIHAAVWKKGDERMVYNMIYANPEKGKNYAKRFAITAITRNKEYAVAKGGEKAKVVYFTANPNGESELVQIQLSPNCAAKKKTLEYNFDNIDIKGRGSTGNIVTRWPIRKVTRKELGESSLGGVQIWLDETVGRLNTEERGRSLGEFNTGDEILVINSDGTYHMTDFELTNRYDMEKAVLIERWTEGLVVSAVYFDGEKEAYYAKRFEIETTTFDQAFPIIAESKGSKLEAVSVDPNATIEYYGGKKLGQVTESIPEFIDVKGWKAQGNILTKVKQGNRKMKWVDPEKIAVGSQLEWDV